MNKGGLARSHVTMKSENSSRWELPPEVPGSPLYLLQMKAELHAIKIGTFVVDMETINWKVEGMSCSSCALTISKFLEKGGGRNVKVSLASGDVSFDINGDLDRQQLQRGINKLGYTVVKAQEGAPAVKRAINKHLRY